MSNEMIDDELNNFLYEFMFGCLASPPFGWGNLPEKDRVCQKCGEPLASHRPLRGRYNFTTDLNAVALVETAVIEKYGEFEYGTMLCETVIDEGGVHDNPNLDNKHAARLAMATAIQRARACAAVIKEQGDE